MSETPRARCYFLLGGGPGAVRAATALARAMERGECAPGEIRVVDRDPRCAAAAALTGTPGLAFVQADWLELLIGHVGEGRGDGAGGAAAGADLLVPGPSAPELFTPWLTAALAHEALVERVQVRLEPGTPVARVENGGLFVSHAEWSCPARCLEPALCPVTRQPRHWEIARALAHDERSLRAAGLRPLLGFLGGRSAHLGGGVSGFPLADWRRAVARVRALLHGRLRARAVLALAGTISGCHGRVQLVRVTPAPDVAGAGEARPRDPA